MIGPLRLKILRLSVKYSYLFKVVPFYWDEVTGGIKCAETNSDIAKWYFVIFCFISYALLNCATILSSWDTNTVQQRVEHIGYAIVNFFPVIIEAIFLLNQRTLPVFLNLYIRYFKDMSDNFAKKDAVVARRITNAFLRLIFGAAISLPITVLSVYAQNPTASYFIGSSLLTKNYSWWSATLLCTPVLLVTCAGWALTQGFLIFSVSYVSDYIFLCSEIRYRTGGSEYTSNTLRSPWRVILTYRCLQIFTNFLNEIVRDVMLLMVKTVVWAVIFANFIFLSEHKEMPQWLFWGVLQVVVMMLAFIISLYIKLGEIHEVSKKFVVSWKRNTTLDLLNRKLLLKYICSCRLNRIEIGSAGYFRKAGSTGIIGNIIQYTNKLGITLRKLLK